MSDPSSVWRDEMRKEAHRVHESAETASETQFEYAKRWRRVDRVLGGIAAVVAAVAGVGGLSEVVSAQVAGLIAILAAALGAVAASLNAPQTKEKASVSANALRGLQQDARIFMNIDLDTLEQDEARDRLQQLVERQQQLTREAEIPSPKAWERAKNNLEAGSQKYEADD